MEPAERYRGKPLEELTPAELVQAVRKLGRQIQQMRDDHARERLFWRECEERRRPWWRRRKKEAAR